MCVTSSEKCTNEGVFFINAGGSVSGVGGGGFLNLHIAWALEPFYVK